MSSVANLQVELDLDSGSFTGKLTAAGGQIRAFNVDIGRAAESLKNIENRTTSWGSSLRGLVTTIDHTRGSLKALWDVTGEWAVDILKVSGELERMQTLMKGISKETDAMKRSQDGMKSMDFLVGMSQNTPFQLASLTDAFVKMKSAGIDPMNGSLKAIVDSVAKFGGNSETLKHASIAIQQMAGKGVISMEELRRQLGEAVPDAIQNMADGLGLSMKDLVKRISTGTVEAKSALERMFFQMKLNNAGAADDMMHTWTGMMSKLESEIMLTKDNIAKSGFMDAVEEQLKGLMAFLNSNAGKNFAMQLGQDLTSVVQTLGSLIQFIRSNWDVIKTTGELLLTAFAATKITNGIVAIGSAIGGVQKMFQTYSAQVVANQARVDAVYIASARNYNLLMAQSAAQKAAADAASAAADKGRLANGQFASKTWVTLKRAEAAASLEAAAASEAQALAVQRSAGVASVAGTVFQAALGPIGWITLALTVGVTAWGMWGNAAEEAMDRARAAIRKGFATGDDMKVIQGQIVEGQGMLNELMNNIAINKKELADPTISESRRQDLLSAQRDNIAQIEVQSKKMISLYGDYESGRRQIEDEGVRDAVSGTTREWDQKLAEISRGQQQEMLQHKQAIKDKNLSDEEYSKQYTAQARADAEKMSTLQKTYMQGEVDSAKAKFAALKDVNTAEARQLDQQIKAGEERLRSIDADLNQGQKIGDFDSLAGKKKEKKDPTQQAYESFLISLKSKVADAVDEIAGLNGEWAKFMSQYESGKYGARSASELDGIHKLLDAQKDLTEQLKRRKEAEAALKQVSDDRQKIEARLAADTASANKDLSGDIYSSATAGMVGLNRELEQMSAELDKSGHGWDENRIKFNEFAATARAQQGGIDATKFSKDMVEITKKSNANMIQDDRERAQAELQIEIDKINASLAAAKQGGADELAIAKMTGDARMAIAAKTAEFEYANRPAWQKLLDGWQNVTQNMQQAWADAFSDMSTHLVDFMTTGKLNFKGFAEDVLKTILKVMTNKMIAQFAQMIMGSFGGGGTGGFSYDAGGGYTGFANGGIMTSGGPIPLNKYAKGGVANSPQVALFGEGRMPEAYVPLPDGKRIPVAMQGGQQQPAAAAPVNVQVNVINQSGNNVEAQQKGQRFDGESLILDVVLAAANRPGKFRDGMRAGMTR